MNPRRPFARLVPAIVVAAVLTTGCAGWPRVKPDALSSRTRVAIVSFQSEPVRGFGVPMRLEEVDSAHAVFADALTDAGFEVVPTSAVTGCSFYHRLPASKIESGTTAKGLARVQLTGRNVSGLANCAGGADLVVAVYGWPRLDAGLHLGFGQGRIEMLTHVLAWDDRGNELWRDRLTASSEPFAVFAALKDRPMVSAMAAGALREATVRSVERLAQATGRPLKPMPKPSEGEDGTQEAPEEAPPPESPPESPSEPPLVPAPPDPEDTI